MGLVDLTGIDAWAARACARANRNLTTEEWNELVGENVPYRPVCPGRWRRAGDKAAERSGLRGQSREPGRNGG